MSLTAHPYLVLAEQQRKQENLGGANLAPRRPREAPSRVRTALRLVAAGLGTQRHPGHHSARPV